MGNNDQQTDARLRDAIYNRNFARVQNMLADGADLTTADEEGKTPLMVAAKIGAPEIVELLLRAGADPKPKDKLGDTAKMIAYWHGEYRMCAYTPESLKIVALLEEAETSQVAPS